jgi:hypothetical protein
LYRSLNRLWNSYSSLTPLFCFSRSRTCSWSRSMRSRFSGRITTLRKKSGMHRPYRKMHTYAHGASRCWSPPGFQHSCAGYWSMYTLPSSRVEQSKTSIAVETTKRY